MDKKLGKIESVKFGISGYQDVQFGISLTFTGSGGWGVSYFKGFWDKNQIKCDNYCKWTEQDRDNSYIELCKFVSDLLYEAKVTDITKLKGIPVEVTFVDNSISNFRILTEVL